jgi:cbb3-type cytochrome oxidase subunit 3
MTNPLKIFVAVIAVVIVIALSLSLLLITWYAFNRAEFDRTQDEMKASATEIARGDDE